MKTFNTFIDYFTLLFLISNLKLCLCLFNFEEIKSMNYEIDISDIPVLKEQQKKDFNVVQLKSKYGQQYQCKLPDIENHAADQANSKDSATGKTELSISDLLKPLKTSNCLIRTQDWWTYELCYGKSIKQFHIQEAKIVGPVIMLGLYESEFDWSNKSIKESSMPKYHSQKYVNGTKCDLTNTLRSAEVRYYCDEDVMDYIARVDEPGTCSYVINVFTSRLCTHPRLRPKPMPQAKMISCNPLLTETEYNHYLEVQKEENKKLNDLKQEMIKEKYVALNTKIMDGDEAMFNKLKDEMGGPSDENYDQKKVNMYKIFEIVPLVTSIFEKDDFSKLNDLEKIIHDDVKIDLKPLFGKYIRTFEKLKSLFKEMKSLESYMKHLLRKVEKERDTVSGIMDHKVGRYKRPPLEDAFKELVEITGQSVVKIQALQHEYTRSKFLVERYFADLKHHIKKLISLLSSAVIQDYPLEMLDLSKIEATIDNTLERFEISEKSIHELTKALRMKANYQDKLDEEEKAAEEEQEKKESLPAQDYNEIYRAKIERAVREKLQQNGMVSNDKIEVKVIAAGYLDEDEFHSLTNEESQQFQTLIVNLLVGRQEAVHESERQKKLEKNYKFLYEEDEEEAKE